MTDVSLSPLDDLLRAVPAGVVSTDPERVAAASLDASHRPPTGRALALARPTSTEQVSVLLAASNRLRIPVVPQGARSGLVGAASAVAGSLLLDLSGLDRVVDIDVVNRTATAEPGVLVGDLQAAAAERGLFYPPDPASAAIASVGGSIATNAGGMRCIKYGVTRDWVRSLEVVLADGSVVRTRPPTVKSVTGLDLTSLIVGSEGTLAVVTRAVLGLLPAPGELAGVAATFRSVAEAFEAADAVMATGRLPATLELLDAIALRGVRIVRPDLELPETAEAWLIAITDARSGQDEDLAEYSAAFISTGALSVSSARSATEVEALLAARRALSPALAALRGGTTHGDIAVPRSALPELAIRVERLAVEARVDVTLSGHVGDGNLHPTVVFDPTDAEEEARARRVESGIRRLAQQLGGTVAGEHGIGEALLGSVDGELPAPLRLIQRQVKAAFDPNGILNPGRKL